MLLISNKSGIIVKCSACDNKATRLIMVIYKGQIKWIPRCKKCIVKGYKGKIENFKVELYWEKVKE
jgi:hypothetical protein